MASQYGLYGVVSSYLAVCVAMLTYVSFILAAATVSLDQSEYLTYEGNTISVCVNLDGAITEAVVVAFTTEDGTAVSTTTEGQG